MRRVPLLLIIPVLAVTAAGCGEKTLNTDKGEELIVKLVQEQTGSKVTADCPDDVKAKVGTKTDCTIKGADGSTGTVTVTQKDDKGNVDMAGPIASRNTVVPQLEDLVSQDTGADATVTCPDVMDYGKSPVIQCETSDGEGNSRKIDVTFTKDGKFSADYAK